MIWDIAEKLQASLACIITSPKQGRVSFIRIPEHNHERSHSSTLLLFFQQCRLHLTASMIPSTRRLSAHRNLRLVTVANPISREPAKHPLPLNQRQHLLPSFGPIAPFCRRTKGNLEVVPRFRTGRLTSREASRTFAFGKNLLNSSLLDFAKIPKISCATALSARRDNATGVAVTTIINMVNNFAHCVWLREISSG